MAESKGRILPDDLSDADQKRFFDDVEYRQGRREDKQELKPAPRYDGVLRGYKREWMWKGGRPVPKPARTFPDDIAKALIPKMQRLRPIVDEVTSGHNLGIAHKTAMEPYVHKPATSFITKVATEGHNIGAHRVLDRAAARMPVHVGDNLQLNLWYKTRIAQIRGGYLKRFLNNPTADWQEGDRTLAVVSDAVADFGYCLRNDTGMSDRNDWDKRINEDIPEAERLYDSQLIDGLLQSIGESRALGLKAESVGLYAADGHPEYLLENLGLVELVATQQQVRSDHWGDRLSVTMVEMGEVLPQTERDTDRELLPILEILYGEPEPYQPVNL